MVYDNAGNITRVCIYSLGSNWVPVKLLESRTYTYGDTNWCDKLTGYNGTAITYDAVGNPLSYRDGMTMSWQNGRQLASLQTADNSVTYKYDSNGMRTRKSDNNGTTNYYYDSNNNLIGLTKGNNTLLFYYSPSGEVTSFKYNGEIYYYIKNLQGDIVKIIEQSGAVAVSYKYDSWGKITAESGSSVIRELNPFRYRGYVYDTETGLYYLQSRYYDPITGRFLNADIYCDTGSGNPLSTNMFAYCENNSIINFDPTGKWGSGRHIDMTKYAGFSSNEYKTVRDWVCNADAYPCESTKDYSTPFHGRDNALEIGRKLYKLALEVKKSKSKVSFYWTDKEAKNKGKSIEFLKYNTKEGKSSKKTKEAMNAFLNKLKNANSSKKQSQILLGLALHTLQDFFAHVVHVTAFSNTDKFYGKKGYVSLTSYYEKSQKRYVPYKMYQLDDIMGIPNGQFEDNINVFRWRYDTAFALSKRIYRCWSKNQNIKSITASTRNEIYTYKTSSSYWIKNGKKIYETRYWVITSNRYFYVVKT